MSGTSISAHFFYSLRHFLSSHNKLAGCPLGVLISYYYLLVYKITKQILKCYVYFAYHFLYCFSTPKFNVPIIRFNEYQHLTFGLKLPYICV